METDSFSGDSYHFGNNQGISNGNLFQSVDGNTEFNISYHKVNGRSKEDMSKRKTHITQLHVVPGFAHVSDETTHLHRADPSLQVVDDIDLNMEFNVDRVKRKHLRKTMSHPCNFTSGEQTLSGDFNLHNGCSRNGSHSSETFITVSDISLRTLPSQVPPPSRPPPELDARKGYASGFHTKNEQVDSEQAPGDSSPPLFDVEVDMNSSAAATTKVAMHRPESKLTSAKELKGRNKGGFGSNVKSSYNVKNKEAKISGNITTLNTSNDDATRDRRSGKVKISAADERQKSRKAASETLEPLEGKRFVDGNHIKESRSSQESDRSAGLGTWKEATEFFELVGTEEFGKVIRPINHTSSLVQDGKTYEHGRKEGEASNIQDEDKKVKAIVEDYQPVEYKKSEAAKEAYEQAKHIRRSKSSNEERRLRERVKKEKMAEIFEQEENEKRERSVHQPGKTEKKVNKADQSGSLKDLSETLHKEQEQVESDKSKEVDRQSLSEVQRSTKVKESEKKLKDDEEQQLSVQRHKLPQKMKGHGKSEREAFPLGAAEGEEKVKDSMELKGIDERSNEAFRLHNPEEKAAWKREDELIPKQGKQVRIEKGMKDISVKGSFRREESNEGLKQVLGQVENEKGLKEDFELAMKEKRAQKALEQGENEACKIDKGKEKFREVRDGYENGNRLQEASDGVQNVLKQDPVLERNSGNDAQWEKEIESPSSQAFDKEGSVDTLNEDSHSVQSEKMLKYDSRKEIDKRLDKALELIEESGEEINMKFAKGNDETCETESDEILLAAQSSSIHEENIGELEVSQETITHHEIEKTRTEFSVGEKKLEEVEVENLMINGKNRASEMAPGDVKRSGTQSGKVDESSTNDDVLGFGSEQTSSEKTKTTSEKECDPSSQQRKTAHGWDERGTVKQHANVTINHEESMRQMSSSQANTCGDYGRNKVAGEPATTQEAVNVQKTSQRFHVAESTKRKDKSINEAPASVEKDAESVRRERELEKDRLRKIEEEMEREMERKKDRMAIDQAMLEAEREREREKDRMAVDRATFEARDRAYAEARERAERAAFERATAEARQRALAEARERLEKACSEARDKLYADKATAEARLKAERAAVERATAEARERAMQKVKVERAVFESRGRLERSVSDKFGVSFRNDGRQGSTSSVSIHLNLQVINCIIAFCLLNISHWQDMLDPRYQNLGTSTGSRYPYSSVYGGMPCCTLV